MRKALLTRQCPRRLFSSSTVRREIVELAYTRHDPPSASAPSPSHPPIVVMHGLFGSQRNNRSFKNRQFLDKNQPNILTSTRALAKQLLRPVYTIDLRNHGASPHHTTHTYTAMSEDVEAWIKKHSIPSPILIGHSMGAKVAMTLALRNPSTKAYSGIVPVDNAPVDAALKSDFGIYVKGMLEIDSQQDPPITKQSDADKILEKYEKEVGIRQFLLTNLVKDTDPSTTATTRSKEGHTHAGPRLKFRVPLNTLAKALPSMADFPFKDPDQVRYEGPTLVIRGGESRYVADETLPVVGRFFPRFELVDVKGAGHWVISERFDECVSAVVDWVRRVVDGDVEGGKK